MKCSEGVDITYEGVKFLTILLHPSSSLDFLSAFSSDSAWIREEPGTCGTVVAVVVVAGTLVRPDPDPVAFRRGLCIAKVKLFKLAA